MTNDQRRGEVAARLRALGHDFIARSLSDEQLDALIEPLDQLTKIVEEADGRVRTFPKWIWRTSRWPYRDMTMSSTTNSSTTPSSRPDQSLGWARRCVEKVTSP